MTVSDIARHRLPTTSLSANVEGTAKEDATKEEETCEERLC